MKVLHSHNIFQAKGIQELVNRLALLKGCEEEERILKVTKKSGNRGRCRKLSL